MGPTPLLPLSKQVDGLGILSLLLGPVRSAHAERR